MNDRGQDAVHGGQSQQAVVQVSLTALVVAMIPGQTLPSFHEITRRHKSPHVEDDLEHECGHVAQDHLDHGD